MAQKPFGRVLAEARERQGIDLAYASQQLRIRADILRAIERNDFSRMPARGYTRNMVNAYARLLGLNAPVITRQYIEEATRYQQSLRYGDDDGREQSGRRRSRQTERSEGRADRSSDYSSRANANRDMYSDRVSSTPRSASRREMHNVDRYQGRSSRRSQGSAPIRNQNLYTSNPGGGLLSKLPLIIGIVVVILVLVFAISQIISCTSSKSTDNSTSIPVSGVSDTTNSNENSEATQTVVETPPTSVSVEYTISSGVDMWIEVYENGSETPTIAEVASGPSTAVFTVTNKWEIKVVNKEYITLKVDGQVVDMGDPGDDGMYSYTVDFAVVLNQWAQTHKATTTNASNTSNAATTTAA